MKIAIGSDHAGFHLKNQLRDLLRAQGHDVHDVGAFTSESSDYPDFAALVGRSVARGEAERGVLVCGTGVGIGIAANKIRGIRAAAVSESVSTRYSRSHNDANVVCIGERIVGPEVAEEILRVFLETPFSNGQRHVRRINRVTEIENEELAGA